MGKAQADYPHRMDGATSTYERCERSTLTCPYFVTAVEHVIIAVGQMYF
jgi:hypothetical protein